MSCKTGLFNFPSMRLSRSAFKVLAAVAEPDRIQPEQPVGTAVVAEGSRGVVLDELGATAGEDRRPVGKACSLLLAAAGGEPFHVAPVRKHAAADGRVCRCQPGRFDRQAKPIWITKDVEGAVSEEVLRNGENPGFWFRQRPCRTRLEPSARGGNAKGNVSGSDLDFLLRNRETERKKSV
jgi:hypothetical protein